MPSRTKIKSETEKVDEKFDIEPPEIEYIAAKYVISVPVDKVNLKDKWNLRLYASKVLKQKIGDEVQLTSMKVRRQPWLSRNMGRLVGRSPRVDLLVTTKF